MIDTSIRIKTQQFDGPLSLLLHLIQKEEMSIKDLNLNKITKQYLEYINNMQELNFDIAGEYLYLAATLLLLKSKNCVTEGEEAEIGKHFEGAENMNITTQAELVRRLEQLEHYQKMGAILWELPKLGHEVFSKPKINRKAIIDSILTPIDLDELSKAMMDYFYKESKKYAVVKRDRISIKEKLFFLKDFLNKGELKEFGDILNSHGDKDIDNVVITFISLLELARLKKVFLSQSEDHNIYIEVKESLTDLDVDQANGFDEENEEKDEDDTNEEVPNIHMENVNVENTQEVLH